MQRARRVTFPPGEAKEDWAILRALSEVLGERLPYDNRDALRMAIAQDAAQFARPGERSEPPAPDPVIWNKVGAAGPLNANIPLASPISDFYLTNPIARASLTMAQCSRMFVGGSAKMAAE